MLIISDMGTDVVNADNVFAFAVSATPDGTTVLLAHAPGVQTVLAAVGDRPNRALAAIVKASKEGWKQLDLPDLLGPRPNLAVPSKPGLVSGNGQPLGRRVQP